MTYKLLAKPASANPQIKEYVEAAQKGRRDYLIVRSQSGWTARRVLSDDPPKEFGTQELAAAFVRDAGGEVVFPGIN